MGALKMMEKAAKTCFAYRKGRCNALKSIECEGCSFFKTRGEYREGKKQTLKRISTLDKATQMNIMETYYGGKMNLLEEVL